MKKITFILFGLIAGTAFGQEGVKAQADVLAEIVSPLEIVSGTNLNFGTINGTATGGDVTVAFNGNRTFVNPDMEVTSATAPTAASFTIKAASGYLFSITIPNAKLDNGAGLDMDVTFVHNRKSIARRTGTGNPEELLVGGTLTVGDDQTAGSYTGTVEVTVAYE
ncbi:DUF4402 domain-containing protein [Salinimicrobium oceani]|uniref:DUF4402 domain-containing protein n=1 Tax=Salinimicrobium oceani TaxID=2722702 RepID=A0ABX1CYK3_9FLAO|nr:DUF4402 domain-containing protein [Salinimicrobium oceani]NJW53344.1 DUF4402 domain-containing protein [Salinimicrobium oceani]